VEPELIDPLEAMATTRAIRRYRDEPVPDEVLSAVLFAASRAPTGSNRQSFRFLVLRDGERAMAAKRILGSGARLVWNVKKERDGYDRHTEEAPDSPKSRLARTMFEFVDRFEQTPVVILACLERYRPGPEETIGASIYPACQNLLVAARALGYGGVMTIWHVLCEPELRAELGIPDEVFIAATIALGRPVGGHGPVRRRPLDEVVFDGAWGEPAPWITEPEGTRHTGAGPPAG
jgi:nitroreductase